MLQRRCAVVYTSLFENDESTKSSVDSGIQEHPVFTSESFLSSKDTRYSQSATVRTNFQSENKRTSPTVHQAFSV